MEQTECSETSAYKIQTPGNYPEESIQHTEHGESLKSRRYTHFREICFSRNWRGRHSKFNLPLHFSFQIDQMFRALIEAKSATVQNNITSQIQLNNYFKADPSGRAGLQRRSAGIRLLGLRVRIPLAAFVSVSCECYVLSGTGLCVGPITRPEKSYRLWCVVVCDLETTWMRRSWPASGLSATWELFQIKSSTIIKKPKVPPTLSLYWSTK